ncbi:hypothetical protein PC114_g13926 [Phytophthora cactorum]|nr:hypothetical protein PC114_g13926 [Phytophthora cactorum]KAG4051531.1 hypothetical protein PC123_g13271 [Phytophthora cactorum]
MTHLSQWTPGWAGATFTHLADARSVTGLCGLSQAERIRVWWVDDIYIVRSEGWWEDFQHDAALGLRLAKTYWICTFENSIGYDIADSIDCFILNKFYLSTSTPPCCDH